ncbi:hypothetical protein D1872_332750 [compost metagenome]
MRDPCSGLICMRFGTQMISYDRSEQLQTSALLSTTVGQQLLVTNEEHNLILVRIFNAKTNKFQQ